MKNQFQNLVQYEVPKCIFLLLIIGFGSVVWGELTAQNFETEKFNGFSTVMVRTQASFEENGAFKDSSSMTPDHSNGLQVHEILVDENISIESNDGLAWGVISNVLP